MSLTVMSCPPGQTLKVTDVTDEYNCQCDDDDDQNIVECLTDDRKLIIEVCSLNTFIYTYPFRCIYLCDAYTGRSMGSLY